MIIDRHKINRFTHLDKKHCIEILGAVESKFGEIGDFLIEDNEVSFSCYREYFEDALKVIIAKEIKLKLIDKSDDPFFSVAYKIIIEKNAKYIPNRQSDIQPVLISRKIEDKQGKNYQEIIKSFNTFNTTNRSRCSPLKFVEFNVEDNNLVFEEVKYLCAR